MKCDRYFFCPTKSNDDLVTFLRSTSPIDDEQANQVRVEGSCSDPNARNTTPLGAVCTSKGIWEVNANAKCMCKAGFEYSETSTAHCKGRVIVIAKSKL